MRKLLSLFCLFLCAALLTVQTAKAADPRAANIFNSIGGTTTIDRGGSLHSQARSIYSLGGGMTTFQGKRVSLLSADAPSFSAGCNGISWHFGGFAFISLDEIRQLVEAVAQASLGIAVDLAMQTLCPQCYAVMSKLRDMANTMRNAAADACKIAQNFGAMLQNQGIFPSTGRTSECSSKTSGEGKSSSWMDSMAGEACRMLSDAETELGKQGQAALDFLKMGKPATGKTPDRDTLSATGNTTYRALTALGYEDGVIKDVFLSLLGMSVISPIPAQDCKTTFKNLYGDASTMVASTSLSTAERATLTGMLTNEDAQKVSASSATAETKPTDKVDATPTPSAGGATKGPTVCHAPPVLSGIEQVGQSLMCGFGNFDGEAVLFATKHMGGNVDRLANSSLGAMCGRVTNKGQQDPLVYTCRTAEAECLEPRMVRLSTMLGSPAVNGYTGLAWMVGDALYTGVKSVRDNKGMEPSTLKILNGSGWPLYRLLNMAAVYPAVAEELLDAYISAIAAQYAMDTLDKVAAIGAQPSINLRAEKGITPESISAVRQHIMAMIRQGNSTRLQALERLAEKRKIVEVIMQVNKTLQAEVIGQGLTGNANLAVSLKQQATKK